MPPSFYFASRGVVLPAGQNGGLPVATVNVPEVDVQFLRVEPDRVPELFDSVLGLGRSASSSDDDGVDYDGEDGWRYSDNRSLKGSVSNWDLDRLNTLTTSVYQAASSPTTSRTAATSPSCRSKASRNCRSPASTSR